jgi:hypothetical protein
MIKTILKWLVLIVVLFVLNYLLMTIDYLNRKKDSKDVKLKVVKITKFYNQKIVQEMKDNFQLFHKYQNVQFKKC